LQKEEDIFFYEGIRPHKRTSGLALHGVRKVRNMGRLTGKIAVITGGNSGIGLATAKRFVSEGAHVFKGTLFTVQKALPLMRTGGSIILNGSTTGSMGTPAFSVYSATRAAIRNFARSWALDLKGTGIRVNVLSPGATTTPGLLDGLAKTGMQEALLAGLASQAPLERVGNPDETAAVALFLASDDSSFMTGSEVFVDGGLAQV
jgi:NAD(P)-dependent dehydrogenase (short-subunit alcohol dehydrogenase family)